MEEGRFRIQAAPCPDTRSHEGGMQRTGADWSPIMRAQAQEVAWPATPPKEQPPGSVA